MSGLRLDWDFLEGTGEIDNGEEGNESMRDALSDISDQVRYGLFENLTEQTVSYVYGDHILEPDERAKLRLMLAVEPSREAFEDLVRYLLKHNVDSEGCAYVHTHIKDDWPDEVKWWPKDINNLLFEYERPAIALWIRGVDLDYYCDLDDLVELGERVTLTHVKYKTEKIGIFGMRKLENLVSLDLSESSNLNKISLLEYFPDLRHVNLSGCNNVNDFTVLERLAQLESLNLRGCNKLRTIEGLRNLPELQSLDVRVCHSLELSEEDIEYFTEKMGENFKHGTLM